MYMQNYAVQLASESGRGGNVGGASVGSGGYTSKADSEVTVLDGLLGVTELLFSNM